MKILNWSFKLMAKILRSMAQVINNCYHRLMKPRLVTSSNLQYQQRAIEIIQCSLNSYRQQERLSVSTQLTIHKRLQRSKKENAHRKGRHQDLVVILDPLISSSKPPTLLMPQQSRVLISSPRQPNTRIANRLRDPSTQQ